MKKLTVILLMIALLSIGASAVQITSATIGDNNQDRISGVQTTFKITNNATTDMTSISLSAGSGADSSKYALSFSGVPTTLSAGASATITVNGTIPLNHPGVDSTNLKEESLKIGTMTVIGTVGGTQESATADLNMQAINQLEIKKARIECDSTSKSLDDGDRVKNLKPGEDCTLELEIENNFDDDDRNNKKIGDIEFRSVTIRVDSDDNDIDVDDDDDIDDLDANEEDTATFDIEIDDEADDGTSELEIRVTATDENGALHGEEIKVRLEVDRLSHDIQIRRVEVLPSRIDNCQESNVKVTASILNQGKRDEDEVAVEVSASDLKFNDKRDDIELDEDDRTSVSFSIPVKEGQKEGLVRIDVNTFFDNVAPSNSASVELTIDDCEDEEEQVVSSQPTQSQQTVTITQPKAPSSSSGQVRAQAAPTKSASFTDSKAYVALLVIISLLIAGGIAALVVYLVKHKKQ